MWRYRRQISLQWKCALFGCKTCIKFVKDFQFTFLTATAVHNTVVSPYLLPDCVVRGKCLTWNFKNKVIIFSARTGPGSHNASYSVDTEFLSLWQDGQAVKLTTDLHLVVSLGMGGAIHLLPRYACLVWRGKIYFLAFYNVYQTAILSSRLECFE